MNNRVNKINEKQLTWRHVPTDENSADFGSCGAVPKQLDDHWKKDLAGSLILQTGLQIL